MKRWITLSLLGLTVAGFSEPMKPGPHGEVTESKSRPAAIAEKSTDEAEKTAKIKKQFERNRLLFKNAPTTSAETYRSFSSNLKPERIVVTCVSSQGYKKSGVIFVGNHPNHPGGLSTGFGTTDPALSEAQLKRLLEKDRLGQTFSDSEQKRWEEIVLFAEGNLAYLDGLREGAIRFEDRSRSIDLKLLEGGLRVFQVLETKGSNQEAIYCY